MRSALENKIKALIVDDETDACYLLSSILEHKNLQASFVNTINEAKTVLEEESPSIIFLDNHLPDGFGMNFIPDIKQRLPQAKIIMITAHDTQADKNKAIFQGADHFIGKPFTREIIFKAIESLMN
jgi:two-component system OmpR family response regulator